VGEANKFSFIYNYDSYYIASNLPRISKK